MWKCSCNNWANDSYTTCPYCGKAREGKKVSPPPAPPVKPTVTNTPPVQPQKPVQVTKPVQPTPPPPPVTQPHVQTTPPVTNGSVPYYNTKGLVIWSWITFFACGFIWGAIALSNAKKINTCSTVEEQQKRIKRCKIWNIVGIVINLLFIIGRMNGG